MKNKFDKHLYIEGLRQLRIPGVILCSAAFAFSIILSLTGLMGSVDSHLRNLALYDIWAQWSISIYLFCIVAPVLFTYVLFRFLNSKKATDFYGAIPKSRACIFFSYSLASLSYIIPTVILTFLTEYLLSVGFNIKMEPLIFLYLILAAIACACLVLAVMILAMSITGRVYMNLIVCGMILFYPKILSAMFCDTLRFMNPVFSVQYDSFLSRLMSARFNLVTNPSVIQEGGNWTAVIYTFVFAVIYFLLAAVMFIKRNNACAGEPLINKILHRVCSIALIFPLLCYLVTSVFRRFLDVSVLIMLLFVAVLIYLGYEALTKKSAVAMLKSLPYLGLSILFCFGFYGSVVGTSALVDSYLPEADEIEWVTYCNGSYDYSSYMTKNIQIRNNELNKQISDLLKKAQDDTVSVSSAQDTDQYTDYTTAEIYNIKTKNSIFKRERTINYTGTYYDGVFYIAFSTEEWQKKIISENPEYRKAFFTLPKDSEIEDISNYVIDRQITFRPEVWQQFKEEFATLSDEQKYKVLRTSADESQFVSDWPLDEISNGYCLNINVQGTINLQRYYQSYSVEKESMPKTFKMMHSYYCQPEE